MFPTKTLFSFILLVSFYSVSAQVDYFPERNAIWLEKTPSELNVDLEWLNDAVDFAKENEYSYILDTSAGVVLYFPETDDILPLVKTKLGIQ